MNINKKGAQVMEYGTYFRNGYVLEEGLNSDITKKVIKLIKEELPEEAQTYEIYKHILNNTIELMEYVPFELKL